MQLQRTKEAGQVSIQPDADALRAFAAREGNPARKIQLIRDAEELDRQDMPWITVKNTRDNCRRVVAKERH